MLEKHIEEHLRERVKAVGGIAYKFSSPNRRSVPDRLCVLPPSTAIRYGLPKVFFVELKAPGKKPTSAQLREHDRLRSLGETVLVIDTKEKVDALFSRQSDTAWRAFL